MLTMQDVTCHDKQQQQQQCVDAAPDSLRGGRQRVVEQHRLNVGIMQHQSSKQDERQPRQNDDRQVHTVPHTRQVAPPQSSTVNDQHHQNVHGDDRQQALQRSTRRHGNIDSENESSQHISYCISITQLLATVQNINE